MPQRNPSASQNGQALVELAIMLPLLFVLLLGIYDFACAIRAQNSISNMSREGANLASRPSAGMQDRKQEIMNALAVTAKPLEMKTQGMMFITVVQGNAILTQDRWEGGDLKETMASRVGTPTPSQPNPAARGLDSLALGPTRTVYVVEVFYNYKSLFAGNALMLGSQLYSRTVF